MLYSKAIKPGEINLPLLLFLYVKYVLAISVFGGKFILIYYCLLCCISSRYLHTLFSGPHQTFQIRLKGDWSNLPFAPSGPGQTRRNKSQCKSVSLKCQHWCWFPTSVVVSPLFLVSKVATPPFREAGDLISKESRCLTKLSPRNFLWVVQRLKTNMKTL